MASKIVDSEFVLNYIQAPQKITSMEMVKNIIHDPACLTLIDVETLRSLEATIKQVVNDGISGDFVMVGVFKGGAALFVKSVLENLGYKGKLWLFESFVGFDRSNLGHQTDRLALDLFGTDQEFQNVMSPEKLKNHFQNLGVFEDVHIVPGFFENSFESIDVESIAWLHVDVDCYEPTLACLELTNTKMSVGSWSIVDDYFAPLFECKKAVDKFLLSQSNHTELSAFGSYSAGWRN
jgi:O-methyltransferase